MTAHKIYPLNAPGMVLPGADFFQEAESRGDTRYKLAGRGSSTKLE